jgi:hypothetical protein
MSKKIKFEMISRLRVFALLGLVAALGFAAHAEAQPTITGWQVVSVQQTFAPSEAKLVIALCPPGKHVLGGGYFPKDYQDQLGVLGSWPSDKTGSGITADGSSWAVYAHNLSPTVSPSIVVYAICANA